MRLPHRATLLRPTTVESAYGDPVDGPLAAVGEPFPSWLQTTSSTESGALVTFVRLYFRDVPFILEADDVVEVAGRRYTVDGEPVFPVNPQGRARYSHANLKRVTRGGK